MKSNTTEKYYVNSSGRPASGIRIPIPKGVMAERVAVDLLGAPEGVEIQSQEGVVVVHWPLEVVENGACVRITLTLNGESCDRIDLCGDWIVPSPESTVNGTESLESVALRCESVDLERVKEIARAPTLLLPALPISSLARNDDAITIAERTYFVEMEANVSYEQFGHTQLPRLERVLRRYAATSIEKQLTDTILARIHSRRPPPAVAPAWVVAECTRMLSSLLATVTRRHFTAGRVDDAALPIEELGFTYRRFASRNLAPSRSYNGLNCEPDSEKYFLFAEFGFLAIELGIDAGFWDAYLRGFLPSLHVFIETFGGNRIPLRWQEYGRMPWRRGSPESDAAYALADRLVDAPTSSLLSEYEDIVRRAFCT